jgi:hypothetical protein
VVACRRAPRFHPLLWQEKAIGKGDSVQRWIALVALLVGGTAIAVIVVASGGDDRQPPRGSEPSSQGQAKPGRTETGTPPGSSRGTAGRRGSAAPGRSGRGERAAARREARARQGRPTRRRPGRLGTPTGGTPPALQPSGGPRGASVYTIVVQGGGAIGGVQRINLRKDDRVRLIVQSDVADVVQIPGYGLARRVRPGGSARFYFDASKQGLYAIELAGGRTRIGVLSVN